MNDSQWPIVRPFWIVVLVLATLVAIGYAPAINNGFIADDYVIMQRTEILKTDLGYLFSVVPENFRATSYAVFSTIRSFAGYDSRWFYLFTIALHIINCILFYKLLRHIDETTNSPFVAAILFTVFQAPQEAVMWLAAMNEELQAFFILMAMLLWDRQDRRHLVFSVICFSLALVSKVHQLSASLAEPATVHGVNGPGVLVRAAGEPNDFKNAPDGVHRRVCHIQHSVFVVQEGWAVCRASDLNDPTGRRTEETRADQRIVDDFPYPQIPSAKAAALAAPGWRPELIKAGKSESDCRQCLILRWDENKNLASGTAGNHRSLVVTSPSELDRSCVSGW